MQGVQQMKAVIPVRSCSDVDREGLAAAFPETRIIGLDFPCRNAPAARTWKECSRASSPAPSWVLSRHRTRLLLHDTTWLYPLAVVTGSFLCDSGFGMCKTRQLLLPPAVAQDTKMPNDPVLLSASSGFSSSLHLYNMPAQPLLAIPHLHLGADHHAHRHLTSPHLPQCHYGT